MQELWLTDITTLNAVESLFRGSVRDPWAISLAGAYADYFAYSPALGFILPDPSPRATGPNAPTVPSIIEIMSRRDTSTLLPVRYSTASQLHLDSHFLEEALSNFLTWCRLNPGRLRQWLTLHREAWISGGHAKRVPSRFVYEIEKITPLPEFISATERLQVNGDDLAYAFDVALRYPLYGELAGPTNYYLSHPLREGQSLPTMTVTPKQHPPLGVSFSPSVARLAKALSLDQYTSLLHELRNVVASEKLDQIKPGEIENEEIRRISADLALPVRLKGWAKAAGVGAAVLGGLAAVPTVAVAATVCAATVAVASLFWDGRVPRAAGKKSWLRWALKWDLEK